jgi:hypothetical protein
MSNKPKVEKKIEFHLIKSTKELREVAPSLVEKVNADPKLAMLAAANPILLLEELGYTFTDESRAHLEHIFRFSKEKAKEIESLESDVYKIAGKRFNIRSEQELDRVLFKELKIQKIKQFSQESAKKAEQQSNTPQLLTAPLKIQLKPKKKIEDPLENLKEAHPIMKPLLAYRKLESSTFRLATPEAYRKIKQGEYKLPISKITFHLPDKAAKRGA